MQREEALRRVLDLEREAKTRQMRGQIGRVADENITMHQCHVLALLMVDGQVPTSAIAEAMGIAASVATGIVQRLVERGFVERSADPDDRRVHLLSLSPQGTEFMSQAIGALERGFAERIVLLSDAQLLAYVDILETLSEYDTPKDETPAS